MRNLLAILVACVFLVACRNVRPVLDASAPCDEIIHPALLSVPFDELAQGQEQTEQWLVTHFPTATVKFFPSDSNTPGNGGSYTVKTSTTDDFRLYLVLSSKFVSMYPLRPRPTLGHIIQCYGAPEYYRFDDTAIGQEGTGVFLELWYPSQGIKFTETSYETFAIRRYVLESALNVHVQIFAPGTIATMLQDWGGSEEYIQAYLESPTLKQWPENFTELTLED